MKQKFKHKHIMSILAICSIFVFSLTACSQNIQTAAHTNSRTDSTSPTYKDVVFATVKNDDGKTKKLRMNIFKQNKSSKNTPVLVYIHGGAWAMGDYKCEVNVNTKLAAKATKSLNKHKSPSEYSSFKSVVKDGITFVSVDYRLSTEAAFPAQIYDVKGSIRYLRANAKKYGIDPNRIAVCGESAGGHLAALLATSGGVKELEGDVGGNLNFSSKVIACVDFFGPTDLLSMGPEMDPSIQSPADAAKMHDSPDAAESKLLGFDKSGQGVGVLRQLRDKNDTSSPYWSKVKLAELGSPINNVTSDDPPTFIAHGGNDTLVPIKESLKFSLALTHAGVKNTFMTYSKDPHGYQSPSITNSALKWIKLQLKSK
ncbi:MULTISPECIES: alpha/beta hydrolase [Clostridium]|uniref:alpha/beta hydrolase n=1 Tax=Clostridium TaxID=1485 RepID=UPI000826C9F6|nr:MULTISPECIES: alpha/beta hydrolase [Clostridium]PJI07509.1 alpha/beta hydrolase [Clostridium sp. CT7]